MTSYSPSRIVAALERGHLIFFLLRVFAILHAGAEPLRLVWYLLAMCFALEEAAAGRKRRLVINLPPRHLKSITASVALVAWALGRDPRLKIIVATYSADLAREHAENCRTIMESTWYMRLFPKTRLKAGNNRRLSFVTTAGGGRRSISVTGSTTGLGADLIILDDCMKADDIDSEVVREKSRRWYTNTLLPRLNSKKHGTIISIQQRLGEEDLTALLIAKGAEHLCFPARAVKVETIPLGFKRQYRRPIGELLNPEREDDSTLKEIARELGPYVYEAQYQQSPVAPEGNLINISKFPRYQWPMDRRQFVKVVISWDTGMSAQPTSDFSVATIWGYLTDKWYLLDVFRRQLDYPDLRDAVVRLYDQWRPDRVLIEDAGSGTSLYQELHRYKHCLQPLMIAAVGSKAERMRGQLGQIEDGRILLPEEAPWLDEFLAEARAFPYRKNDDQVDSMSQFLAFAMSRNAWVNMPIHPETGRKMYVRRRDTVTRRAS